MHNNVKLLIMAIRTSRLQQERRRAQRRFENRRRIGPLAIRQGGFSATSRRKRVNDAVRRRDFGISGASDTTNESLLASREDLVQAELRSVLRNAPPDLNSQTMALLGAAASFEERADVLMQARAQGITDGKLTAEPRGTAGGIPTGGTTTAEVDNYYTDIRNPVPGGNQYGNAPIRNVENQHIYEEVGTFGEDVRPMPPPRPPPPRRSGAMTDVEGTRPRPRIQPPPMTRAERARQAVSSVTDSDASTIVDAREMERRARSRSDIDNIQQRTRSNRAGSVAGLSNAAAAAIQQRDLPMDSPISTSSDTGSLGSTRSRARRTMTSASEGDVDTRATGGRGIVGTARSLGRAAIAGAEGAAGSSATVDTNPLTPLINQEFAGLRREAGLRLGMDSRNVVASVLAASAVTQQSASDVNRNLVGAFQLSPLLQGFQGPQNVFFAPGGGPPGPLQR